MVFDKLCISTCQEKGIACLLTGRVFDRTDKWNVDTPNQTEPMDLLQLDFRYLFYVYAKI